MTAFLQLNMYVNAPAVRQGLCVAYKMLRHTLSRLRFLLVTYVSVRSRREIRALLVLLAFSNGKMGEYNP